MNNNRITKFDPWLLGAMQKAMGKLPEIPGDLLKIKSLTFYDGAYISGEDGLLLNGWMELASGDFSAIGRMPNLHTLLFRNHRILKVGNFDFLSQCRKLKKLDCSGTDFSDCELLEKLPCLQYVMLPDRSQLIHTQALERIQAQAETEPEMNERARAKFCLDTAAKAKWKISIDLVAEEQWKISIDTAAEAEQKASIDTAAEAEQKASIDTTAEAERKNKIDTTTETGYRADIDTVVATGQKVRVDTAVEADPRLIYWIAVSLGKMPRTPQDLKKVRLLDSRKRIPALEASTEKLPSWFTAKEGDFSLIGRLPNLQALLLWGVLVDDFSFLSECRELIYINLWDTNFADCSLLAGLPYLRLLYLPDRSQLENFSLLEKRRDTYQQEIRQRLEDFLYRENTGKLSEAEQAQAEQVLVSPPGFLLVCGSGSAQEIVPAKRCDLPLPTKTQLCPNDIAEVVYEEQDFDDLVTVRGEDVVISYEGASRVRHVEAEFCMGQTPGLWKVFSRVRDEEDNWAKLSPENARQLTDALSDAIRNGNVATLYLSLEPWGEGHLLILEFCSGWVDITYMDDETPVYYESYNPAYKDSTELSPIEYEGQTPIPKMLALDDMQLAAEIVRHFIATGQLLPGTLWKTGNVNEIV